MHLGISLGLTRPSGGFSAAAQAFFGRLATPPTEARAALYNALINSLAAAGIWDQLDALYVFAAADQATALTNLKSASFGATAVNSPDFTADRGFQGDGATSYIATGFTPSLHASAMQLNSAHIAAWNMTDRPMSATALAGADSNFGLRQLIIYPFYSDNTVYMRVNNGDDAGIAGTNSAGMFLGNRSSSTGREAYRNGVSLGAYPSSSSTGLPAAEVFALAVGSSGTPAAFASDEIAMLSFGGSLTAAQAAAYHAAVETYLTAVGAPI